MAQQSMSELMRQVSREERHPANRLKSIREDADRLTALLRSTLCDGALPVFANLRCGAWYVPRRDGTCYFKSADGHYGQWKFSMTRLNLHLLRHQQRGFCIVDATQHGKRFPDSFSKTIPLWCQVLNAALGSEQHLVPMREAFPPWISDNEVNSIERDFQTHVKEFMTCGLRDEVSLLRPLKCVWCAARDADAAQQLQMIQTTITRCGCTPVGLICASGDSNQQRARCGWSYYQGAADDHQSWSCGLTEDLFWHHVDYLTDAQASLEEIQSRIDAIVRDRLQHQQQPALSSSSDGGASEHLFQVGALPLYLKESSSVLGSDSRSVATHLSSRPAKVRAIAIPHQPSSDPKHGIERSLHDVLCQANDSLNCGEAIVLHGGELKLLCVYAIAIVTLFCRGADTPLHFAPLSVSAGGLVGDEGQHLSVVHAITSRGIDKQRIQWAHRFVVNSVGCVFPSRAHVKQINRYFLTTPDLGKNTYN